MNQGSQVWVLHRCFQDKFSLGFSSFFWETSFIGVCCICHPPIMSHDALILKCYHCEAHVWIPWTIYGDVSMLWILLGNPTPFVLLFHYSWSSSWLVWHVSLTYLLLTMFYLCKTCVSTAMLSNHSRPKWPRISVNLCDILIVHDWYTAVPFLSTWTAGTHQ